MSFYAKQLPIPSFLGDSEKRPRVMSAQASWNLNNVQFPRSGHLQKIHVVGFGHLRNKIAYNIRAQIGHHMPGTNVAAETSQDWKQALSRAAIGHCVIVILEERSEDEYAEIKCMGDLESGRHVLCMLREKVEKGVFPKEPALGTSPHLQYLSNIVMKLNIKAGGINHRVKLYQKVGSDTIVMGADVSSGCGPMCRIP